METEDDILKVLTDNHLEGSDLEDHFLQNTLLLSTLSLGSRRYP